jgi:serine/threonine protein kinase
LSSVTIILRVTFFGNAIVEITKKLQLASDSLVSCLALSQCCHCSFHRDIKSAELFIQTLDFPLAKLSSAAGDASISNADGLNSCSPAPGTALVTVAYTSPEQARGEELDAGTDLSSFGVVLYEMPAGRLPFS